jgi:hypothetical protein
VRECLREFGVTVRVSQPIGAFRDSFAGGEIAIYYRCEIESGEPGPADLVDAIDWFQVSAPPPLAFESTAEAVKALQRSLK